MTQIKTLPDGKPAAMIEPHEVSAYAVTVALAEQVAKGTITPDLLLEISLRADELAQALLRGQVLSKNANGTYEVKPVEGTLVPGNDEDTLVIG